MTGMDWGAMVGVHGESVVSGVVLCLFFFFFLFFFVFFCFFFFQAEDGIRDA